MENAAVTCCSTCEFAAEHHWWGPEMSNMTHCRGCHRTWRMSSRQAHCTVCCAHFTTPLAFDAHLAPVGVEPPCRPPGSVINKKTEAPRLVQREDGAWAFPSDERFRELTSARRERARPPQTSGWSPSAPQGS